MKSGLLKHPYLGDVRTYTSNNRPLMELKINKQRNPQWFRLHQQYKSYPWKYCLFPQIIMDNQEYELDSMKAKQTSTKKVVYSGYFVTTLKDQILTRYKNKANFKENQILYVLYTVACAWREWKQFVKRFGLSNNYNAISSQHILLNQEGDIKLITPYSAPVDFPSVLYYAPQNIPPNIQSETAWNKSIIFSLGLIGSELIAMKTAYSLYQNRGNQLKFIYQQYQNWIKPFENSMPKQVYNLVTLMTDKNPWVRLKIGQFQAILLPYQDQILNGRLQKLDYGLSKASLLEYLKNKKQKREK